MVVLSALRRTVVLLADRPALLPAVVALNLAPQLASLPRFLSAGQGAELVTSLVGIVLGPVFLVPALSLVDNVTDGDDVGVAAATEDYGRRVLSLVGANVTVVVALVLVVFVFVLLAAVLGVLGILLTVVAVAAFVVALQFVDVAVVVTDQRAMDAVAESVAVARTYPAAAVGFAAVRLGVGLAATLPFLLASNAVSEQAFRLTPTAAVLGLVSLVVSSVLLAYRVTFYRRLTADRGRTPAA